MKNRFEREFENWPLSNNEHLMITGISAEGNDLEELLSSAECSIEDWHGNTREPISANELTTTDYALVEQEIQSYLADRAEADAERYEERKAAGDVTTFQERLDSAWKTKKGLS